MRQISCLLVVYLSLSQAQTQSACPPGTCGGGGCYGLPCGTSACCSQFFQFCANATGPGLCCENTQTYIDGTCCPTGTSNFCNGVCCPGNCTASGACQRTQPGCEAIGGTGTICETNADCCNGRTPLQRATCVKFGAVSCVQGCCVEN